MLTASEVAPTFAFSRIGMVSASHPLVSSFLLGHMYTLSYYFFFVFFFDIRASVSSKHMVTYKHFFCVPLDALLSLLI